MFRFRLRTLMIGVTLFAVLLGGRLEYIRRQVAFHRREAASALAVVAQKEKQPIAKMAETVNRFADTGEKTAIQRYPHYPISGFVAGRYTLAARNEALEDWRRAVHHEQAADAYERARVRPWMWVDDTISTATLPDAPTKPPPATMP